MLKLETTGDVLLDRSQAYLVAGSIYSPRVLQDDLVANAVGEVFGDVLRLERSSEFVQLALCAPQRRVALLKKFIGRDAEQILQQAKKELEVPLHASDEATTETPAVAPWVEAPTAGRDAPVTHPATPTANVGQKADTDQEVVTARNPDQPHLGVEVKEVKRSPSKERRVIAGRVQTTRVESSRLSGPYQQADGPLCQDVAFWFEETGEQGRFPLDISHYQGHSYWGCDLLSFRTETDRDLFKTNRGEELVERFIEVKGRSSPAGTVDISGNELDAARRYGARYCLYRIFQSPETGSYELVILPDPVNTNFREVCIIDPFRAPARSFWSIKEIFASGEVEQTE